jgi:formylmethanofuran dehydrogenase subunit E
MLDKGNVKMSNELSSSEENMTWNDETVYEVRRVRDEHAEKFNYDVSAICADIRQKQAESKRKVVSLEKNESEKKTPDFLQAA